MLGGSTLAALALWVILSLWLVYELTLRNCTELNTMAGLKSPLLSA